MIRRVLLTVGRHCTRSDMRSRLQRRKSKPTTRLSTSSFLIRPSLVDPQTQKPTDELQRTPSNNVLYSERSFWLQCSRSFVRRWQEPNVAPESVAIRLRHCSLSLSNDARHHRRDVKYKNLKSNQVFIPISKHIGLIHGPLIAIQFCPVLLCPSSSSSTSKFKPGCPDFFLQQSNSICSVTYPNVCLAYSLIIDAYT